MILNFNVKVAERKKMVVAIEEAIGKKAKYLRGECKIVCVKSNCADLFYAPYWGKQLKGWISNGKT